MQSLHPLHRSASIFSIAIDVSPLRFFEKILDWSRNLARRRRLYGIALERNCLGPDIHSVLGPADVEPPQPVLVVSVRVLLSEMVLPGLRPLQGRLVGEQGAFDIVPYLQRLHQLV